MVYTTEPNLQSNSAQFVILLWQVSFSYREHPPPGRVSKTRQHRQQAGRTFWIAGTHFGQHVLLFCCILTFVVNHSHLTVHSGNIAVVTEFLTVSSKFLVNIVQRWLRGPQNQLLCFFWVLTLKHIWCFFFAFVLVYHPYPKQKSWPSKPCQKIYS